MLLSSFVHFRFSIFNCFVGFSIGSIVCFHFPFFELAKVHLRDLRILSHGVWVMDLFPSNSPFLFFSLSNKWRNPGAEILFRVSRSSCVFTFSSKPITTCTSTRLSRRLTAKWRRKLGWSQGMESLYVARTSIQGSSGARRSSNVAHELLACACWGRTGFTWCCHLFVPTRKTAMNKIHESSYFRQEWANVQHGGLPFTRSLS